MSRFNEYINCHFGGYGCRLIARARDEHRGRDVTLHQIPGYWDCVGVSDGTDAWIAPAAASPFFRTATGDVADILRRLQAGDPIPVVPDAPPRRRVRLDDATPSQPQADEAAVPQRRSRVRI